MSEYCPLCRRRFVKRRCREWFTDPYMGEVPCLGRLPCSVHARGMRLKAAPKSFNSLAIKDTQS